MFFMFIFIQIVLKAPNKVFYKKKETLGTKATHSQALHLFVTITKLTKVTKFENKKIH